MEADRNVSTINIRNMTTDEGDECQIVWFLWIT